ncbi:NAD(P)-dependent dehydrogenase (short-subunit alcohol dehydrogenase family) [Microbacterium aurum]|nr:NAD(P)-dependent dehydrogenase (short-subunit alcohol dehydrogenase family) [Microbacterium aurum]
METRARIEANGGEAFSVAGDVADEEDAERMVEQTAAHFGTVDVLVNNAALLETSPILDTDIASFDRVMNANVRGVFLMIRAAGRRMVDQRYGVIINIGSDLAVRGRADYAAYAASKGAVLQLTRTAAIELGTHGVRVVMLSPAVTNTELARPALEDPQTRAELLSKGTLQRINEPEDVAAAAVFLASSAARTVTGCNWPIDAGVLAR